MTREILEKIDEKFDYIHEENDTKMIAKAFCNGALEGIIDGYVCVGVALTIYSIYLFIKGLFALRK